MRARALERTTIPCTMADGCKFTFSSAIRGFHVYGKTWSPRIGQQLQTVKASSSHQTSRYKFTPRSCVQLAQHNGWENSYARTVTAPPTAYRDEMFVNIIKYGYYTRAVLISLNKMYLRFLFEGGTIRRVAIYYSSKYGIHNKYIILSL